MLLVTNLANTQGCKKTKKLPKPWQMGTHLRDLNESYPCNEYQHSLDRWFLKNLCILVLWTKVASALDGLTQLFLRVSLEIFNSHNLVLIWQKKVTINTVSLHGTDTLPYCFGLRGIHPMAQPLPHYFLVTNRKGTHFSAQLFKNPGLDIGACPVAPGK